MSDLGKMYDPIAVKSSYLYLAQHPELFEAIESGVDDPLRVQAALRSRFPADAVRLALTVSELRRRAAKKFPQASQMWFDRTRLEQATPWPVATHKAQRFNGPVYDFCCGAGADSLALADRAAVTAVDSDPVACLFTQLNAQTLGKEQQILIREARVEDIVDRSGFVHIDPDRRVGTSRRTVRVEDYVPGLAVMQRLTSEFSGGAIKLSPAANFGGKFEDVEIELVSLDGECKEATIWFGSLGQPELWRATLLPSGESLAGDPLSVEPEVTKLEGYLYDPDPAIVRAGLVDLLCSELGLTRLDSAEEYLTSDRLIETPFAKPFAVIDELPNNERALKKYLGQAGVGLLEIKARRLPVNVEKLHQRLAPLKGERSLTIVFARIDGKAKILVTERVPTVT